MGQPLEVIIRKEEYRPHSLRLFVSICVIISTFFAFVLYKTGDFTEALALLLPLTLWILVEIIIFIRKLKK